MPCTIELRLTHFLLHNWHFLRELHVYRSIWDPCFIFIIQFISICDTWINFVLSFSDAWHVLLHLWECLRELHIYRCIWDHCFMFIIQFISICDTWINFVLSFSEVVSFWWEASFFFGESNDRGHTVFVLFVCLSITSTLTNLWTIRTIRNWDFVFGVHTPLMRSPFKSDQFALSACPSVCLSSVQNCCLDHNFSMTNFGGRLSFTEVLSMTQGCVMSLNGSHIFKVTVHTWTVQTILSSCYLWWLIDWLNWLLNVTINDISVIYVTAHRCAGGTEEEVVPTVGLPRHRHFAGFFNVPVLAPTRDHPFYTVIPTHRPI